MKRSRAFLAVMAVSACGGSRPEVAPEGPPRAPASDSATLARFPGYVCFRVDAPATKTVPAGPRGMCAPTVDECQIGRRTVLDSLTAELGNGVSLAATECQERETAVCTHVVRGDGPSYNACGPEAAICSWMRGNLARSGTATTGPCLEHPASRRNLPAVEPIEFRMWCFRDQTTPAGSDCVATQRDCEDKVKRLVTQGALQPRAWSEGAFCAAHDRVVCYPQLDRRREQVLHICTPSFEECQARAGAPKGADFEVLGGCGLVTGNKP